MKPYYQRLLGLAAVVAFGIASARAEVQDKTEKSFTVAKGDKLLVKADRGNISVKTGDTLTARVEVRRVVKRATDEKAAQILKDHQISIEQKDGVITVTSHNPKNAKGWSLWGKANLNVEWDITIPKDFAVDLATAGGNVAVGDLNGPARAQTAGGNVTLAHIKGSAWAKTAGGNISVAEASSQVEAFTAGGNIGLGAVSGKIHAQTAGGDIKLSKGDGEVTLETSGGNIRVGEVTGSLDATTSGGDITAALQTQPKSKYHLVTSGGNIEVQVPETAALDLDADTSAGQVQWGGLALSNPPKQPTSHVRSSINGGGSAMVLRTSGGDIRLRKI